MLDTDVQNLIAKMQNAITRGECIALSEEAISLQRSVLAEYFVALELDPAEAKHLRRLCTALLQATEAMVERRERFAEVN
jgi:hypothetical protein